MNPFAWNWLVKSLLSLACVIPAWLSINFFKTYYQIPGEITMIWYFLGTALGTAALLKILDPSTVLMPPLEPLLIIFAVGVIFGSGANALLFSAIADAPNQAIPQAIQGGSAGFIFFIAAVLSSYLPVYFRPQTMELCDFIAIALILVGVSIIASLRH